MPSESCVSEADMRSVHAGRCDDAAIERVFRHLESCTSCADRYRALSSEVPIGHEVRGTIPRHGLSRGDRIGRYTVVSRLGAGASGVVYLCEETPQARKVAIKVLDARHSLDGHFRERFRREGRLLSALRNRHVVRLEEFDDSSRDAVSHLVLEWIDGENLRERLVRDTRIPESEAVELIRQAALGLAAVHSLGVVHRDLKPANLLVERDTHRVAIADFGVAHAGREAGGDLLETLTKTGSSLGTLEYMSPEQVRGFDKAREAGPQPRSDVFSLGVILYEVVTGQRPFQGVSDFETARRIVEDEPPLPRTIDGTISRDLETVILRCLRKEPQERLDAQRVADELARIQAGLATTLRRENILERAVRWSRRNPGIASLWGAIAVLLCVASIASLGMARASDRETGNVKSLNEILVNVVRFLPGADDFADETPDRDRKLIDFRDQLRDLQRVATDDTLRLSIFTTLSRLHFALGEPEDGNKVAREALSLVERRMDAPSRRVATSSHDTNFAVTLRCWLSAQLTTFGRVEDALAELELVRKKYGEIIDAEPVGSPPSQTYVNARRALGIKFLELDRLPEAWTSLKESLRLVSDAPEPSDARTSQWILDSRSTSSFSLAEIAEKGDDRETARRMYLSATQDLLRLSDEGWTASRKNRRAVRLLTCLNAQKRLESDVERKTALDRQMVDFITTMHPKTDLDDLLAKVADLQVLKATTEFSLQSKSAVASLRTNPTADAVATLEAAMAPQLKKLDDLGRSRNLASANATAAQLYAVFAMVLQGQAQDVPELQSAASRYLEHAVHRLDSAISLGWNDPKTLTTPEFALVRSHPRFRDLQERLRSNAPVAP